MTTKTEAKVQRAFEAALHELTPVQAETLRSLYGLGDGIRHGVAEVAAAFGVSPSTIRRRRDAGLRALRYKIHWGDLAGLL